MTSNDEQHFGFVGPLIGRAKKCLFPEQAGMAPSKSNSANPNGNGKRNKSRAKRSQLTGDSSLLVAATTNSRSGCVEVGASLQHLFKENEAPVVNQRRIIQKMDSLAGVFEVNDNSLSREIQKSLAGERSRSRRRSSVGECSLANNAGDAQRHRETKVFAQSQVQKHPSRGRVEGKPKQRNNSMQYSLSNLSSRSQMVVVGERENQNPMSNQLSTQTEVKNDHATNSKKEKSRRRGRKNNTISALVQERSVSKGGANKRNYGVSSLMTLPSSTTKSNPQPFNPTSRKHRSRKPLSTNDDSICETMQYTGNPIVNDGDHLASLTKDVEALALRDARNSSDLPKSDPETHQIDQSSFAFQSEQRPTCNPPSSSPQRDQDDTITHNEQMTFSFTSPLKSPSFRSPFAIRHRNPNGFISPPSYIHRLSSLTNADIFQKSYSPFTDTNSLKRLDKKKTPAKLTPASPLVTEFCISPPAARQNRRSKDGVDRITDSLKIECTPSEQRQRTSNALAEMVNNVDESFDIDGTKRPLAAVISTINGSKLFDDEMDLDPTAVDSISRKEDKQQSHPMEHNMLKEELKNDTECHHKPGSAVLEVEEAIETNLTGMSGAIGSVVIEVEEAIPIDKLMSIPQKMDDASRDAIFLDESRNGVKAMSKIKLGWQRKQPRTYDNTTEGGAIHKTTKKKVRRPKKQPAKSNNPIIEVECGHAKTQLRRSGRESKKTDRLTVAWNDHRKTNDRTSKLEAGVTIKSDRPHRLSAVCDDEVGNEKMAQRDVVDGGESNESDASIDHQWQESSDKLSVVVEDRVEEMLVSPCELETITPTEDGSKSESLVTLDGTEPSSSLQWSNEEISSLRKAQTLVNPTSATFWEDIADLVAGRTSEECRDKWFSLIGTPNVRSKLESRKNISVDEESSDNDEDDLFNSTPFRTTFTKTHSGNFAQKLREAEFDSCFGLSPCIKQHSTLESHLTDVSARKQRTGYNTYINNLRRDLSVLGKVSKKATKHHASTIREDVIRINSKNGSGKLLEDGTVKITVQEDESEEDDIYGFGDDDSLLDEDD